MIPDSQHMIILPLLSQSCRFIYSNAKITIQRQIYKILPLYSYKISKYAFILPVIICIMPEERYEDDSYSAVHNEKQVGSRSRSRLVKAALA